MLSFVTDHLDALTAYDPEFQPTHPTTKDGFNVFIKDIEKMLLNFGMNVISTREEMGTGKIWIVLVSHQSILPDLIHAYILIHVTSCFVQRVGQQQSE